MDYGDKLTPKPVVHFCAAAPVHIPAAVDRSVIEPLLPNKPRGVPRVDDRRVLNGIMWVLRSGAPWRDLPERYGPYTTCYNRFNRWRKKGIWDRLMDAIVEAYDGNIQMIDSSSVRVHQHAAGSKKGVRIVAWVVPEAD